MSTYPILYHGKSAGTLTAEPDGLYTVFTARCAPVADRLRLALFGDTGGAYLGLLLPEPDGGLFLRRRLTRLERSRYPDPIRFAAEEGFSPPEADAPAELPPEPDARWRPAQDGTLRLVLDGKELVAVPAAHIRAPGVPPSLLRVIDGREYLVFPL